MRKILAATGKKQPGIPKKYKPETIADFVYRLAFNAAQATIISTSGTGKIIAANKAACILLGYSNKDLLTRAWVSIFILKDSRIRKMIKCPTPEERFTAFVSIIKKDGFRLQGEITSAFFNDHNGGERMITTITDLSQNIEKQRQVDTKKEKIVADNIMLAKTMQNIIDIRKEKTVVDNIILALAKSDARLAQNNEWKNFIGKTSYDVMVDWNIETDEMYVSDSLEEVFGYKIENYTAKFADFIRCLLPGEKVAVEKKLRKTLDSGRMNWNDSYMFRRHDGSVAATTSRASIVRDEKGKAIRLIGAIHDVSRLTELEKKLKEQIDVQDKLSEIFLVASKLSFDGRWDWNLLTNEFFLGDGFKELFGYATKGNKGNVAADWENHIYPGDKEAVEKGLNDAIASSVSYWEHNYRFTRADGSFARVFNRATIIRRADGKAIRIIGAMQDISKQQMLQEKLEEEIKSKEVQIAEATAEAKKTERSDIGKELHDNVNQLLGASKLYIDLAKRGGKDSELFLSRSSEYTITAIEAIRKLTKRLTTGIISNLGLCEAIENISRDMMEVNPVIITCSLKSFKEKSVGEKFKLALFRIVQEQLNNILKHAGASTVILTLVQNNRFISLSIADNGVGFDTSKKREGIGMKNIKSRAAAFNGTTDFVSQPGKGCTLTSRFPFKTILLNKN